MRRLLTGCAAALAVAAVLWPPEGREASADEKDGTVHLFNGRNLANFYTWLKGEGKNKDSKGVFTVKDGAIRVSGEVFGGLVTADEFENYHLTVEFKWGEKTYPPREKAARDSGVLLHAVGADGGGYGVWMESVECQMIEGGTGDFILVGGKSKPRLTVEAGKRGGQLYYKPGAPKVTMDSGRFNWFARDPKWQDKLGFRGAHDVERPAGEWNTLECVCAGDTITNILNGTVVNKGTKS